MGVIFMVVMLVFAFIVFTHVIPFKLIAGSPDTPTEFGSAWITQDGESTNADQIYTHAEAGQSVIISKQLPDTFFNDSYLNFNAKNINFTVSIDGRIIYRFSSDGPFGLGGMESYFQHVRMDKLYEGETITIQAVPVYSDSSSFFADMAICSVNDYNLYYLQHHGFAFILSLLIFFLGVLLIVQYFAIPHEFHAYDTLSLGIASLAMGAWSCVETQVPLLLLGATTPYLLALDYICLFCAPYPVMMFSSSVLSHRWRLAEHLVLAASVIFAGILSALCLTGQLDWHLQLPLLYALLVILLAAIIASAIRSMVLAKRNPPATRSNRAPIAAVAVFVIFLAIDFFAYAVSNQACVDAASVLRVGFIAMQVILLGSFIMRGNRDARSAAQSETMRKLAFVDALTGIGNRAAFERACDALDERRDDPGFDFLMACFDVDNLKYVNDSFGHEYGDRHLMAASDMLRKSFGPIGELFRVGGDEFSALISVDDPLGACKDALDRLRALEDEYNAAHPDAILRISCGICLLSQTENRTLHEISAIADAAMYADKVEHDRQGARRARPRS